MSANSKIRLHVEELFLNAPKSHRTIELKEELIANLQEKYADLIAEGRDESVSYELVISSIGDIDELIQSLRDRAVYDPDIMEAQRKKSATLVSASVGIYILSILPVIILDGSQFALVPMFICWAAATMILVYNAMSKPKYNKEQENMVEDFKEFTRTKQNKKALRSSINSIIWTSTVVIFLGGGMLTHKWHILWLVFLLAAVVQQIVGLMFLQDDRAEAKEPIQNQEEN